MLSVRSLDMGIPTVATFVVENNAKRSTIQESWYRYYNMKTHSALLAHCEINPPGSHISCFKAASVAHHSPWWLARSLIAKDELIIVKQSIRIRPINPFVLGIQPYVDMLTITLKLFFDGLRSVIDSMKCRYRYMTGISSNVAFLWRHRIKSLLVDRRLGGFRRELKNIELYNQIISVMSCRVASRHATPRHATSRHVTSRHVRSVHVIYSNWGPSAFLSMSPSFFLLKRLYIYVDVIAHEFWKVNSVLTLGHLGTVTSNNTRYNNYL